MAVLVAGCSAGASPAPTTCGGNTVWPPPYFPSPTGEVMATLVGTNLVEVANQGDRTWTVHVAPWVLAACVGWIAIGNSEGQRFLLAPAATAQRRVAFEPGFEDRQVGIMLWDHPCDDRCTDPLTAFLSLDSD